ncbi:hypothetical protein [Roseivirga sp.]|uniref:hypothetical protein n=1 Tax=Roseivirga sp. TaxID=1964215 RepID=UPI003B5222DA
MLFVIVFLSLFGISTAQESSTSEDQLILSSVLFQSDFKNYLHLDLNDERKKIFIVKSQITEELKGFERDGTQIMVASKSDITGKNYIEILEFKITQDLASIHFFYAIENVEVQAKLLKKGTWSVSDIRIIEP